MTYKKILRRVGLLLLPLLFSVIVLAPSPHAYADSTGNGSTTTTCETDNDPLTWILCPVFNAVSRTAQDFFQFIIEPFLKVPPISTNPADTSFKIWSSFRVYGDIVLIIAVVAIVFGEVIGGGVIEAYNMRKMLPRILVSAILINLSVYIVAALVDLTNILGNGVGDLIIAPFKDNGAFNFSLSAGTNLGVFGIGFLGLILTGGTIAAVILAMVSSFGTVAFAGLLAILPVVLAVIATVFTLIFRQGVILFLVIASPVAFALYCLPNTERVFKRWWDLLLEMLLVYPIVIAIFAVADVLSVTILAANGIDMRTASTQGSGAFAGHTIAAFMAFLLQFVPLFLVPFAIRIAGGTLARAHEMVSKGHQTVNGWTQKRAENANREFRIQKHQAQERMYDRLNASASKEGRGYAARKGLGFLAGRVGGYNIKAANSADNAEMDKIFSEHIATGDDSEIRALTANLKDPSARRVLEDGTVQYKSAGGRWIDAAAVTRAQERWGNNNAARQKALAYEMSKAQKQEEIDNLVTSYGGLVKEWGLTDNQAGAMWTGAAYANQNSNLQYKYHKWQSTPNGPALQMDGNALLTEVDEKRGQGSMAMQSADTWASMTESVRRAKEVQGGAVTFATKEEEDKARASAQDTLQRAARVARLYAGSRSRGMPELDDSGSPTGGVSYAPGHVQEEIDNFVKAASVTAAPNPDYDPNTPGSPEYLRGPAYRPDQSLPDRDPRRRL